MRIGSLFSGYGGLDLAVQAVLGGDIAWHVEYDKAPSRILDHHFPGVPNYGDVTQLDFRSVELVDVLTAGYPCQPFSSAGKRKGTNDDRHLWPYVATAIRTLGPQLVILENVRGHLTLGFDVVLGDLADLGFDAEWGIVRASDAGAPHQRARLFVIAYPHGGRREQCDEGQRFLSLPSAGRVQPANAHVTGLEGRESAQRCDVSTWGDYADAIGRWERILGRPAPEPTELSRRGNSCLSPRFTEWLMGLPDGWVTAPELELSKTAQLFILGNGVVPQQAALALDVLLQRTSDDLRQSLAPL